MRLAALALLVSLAAAGAAHADPPYEARSATGACLAAVNTDFMIRLDW